MEMIIFPISQYVKVVTTTQLVILICCENEYENECVRSLIQKSNSWKMILSISKYLIIFNLNHMK